MKPPGIRELLEDPAFRKYMKQVPVLPKPLRWGHPWRLWALTTSDRWRKGEYVTYREAWSAAVKCIKDRDLYADVAIVSRRYFFNPPGEVQEYKVRVNNKPGPVIETRYRWVPTFTWDDLNFTWCWRCRRPSEFSWRSSTHHALRGMPALAEDDPYRCYYCGIRQSAMPKEQSHGIKLK